MCLRYLQTSETVYVCRSKTFQVFNSKSYAAFPQNSKGREGGGCKTSCYFFCFYQHCRSLNHQACHNVMSTRHGNTQAPTGANARLSHIASRHPFAFWRCRTGWTLVSVPLGQRNDKRLEAKCTVGRLQTRSAGAYDTTLTKHELCSKLKSNWQGLLVMSNGQPVCVTMATRIFACSRSKHQK